MSAMTKIIKLLEPISDVEAGEDIAEADSVFDIVNEMLPKNTLMFDSEIIAQQDAYIPLIMDYASITDEEWQPSSIQVSGDIDGTIQISLISNDKTTTWNFEQNGSDYVSEQFLDKISSFSSRNLPGTFVRLPTTDQLISVVYLPKAVAKRFKDIASKTLTIDIACNAIKNNNQDLLSKSWFDNGLHKTNGILEARDAEGDTLYTSSIKGGDERYIQYIKDIGADLVCPGSEGKTPLQIARDYNNAEEIEYLMEPFFNLESNGWDTVNSIINNHPDEYNENIKKLVREITNSENKALLFPYLCPAVRSTIHMGIKPQYFMGDNVINVHGSSRMENLILVFNTTGENSMHYEIRCDHVEAMKHVNKLCEIARNRS
jgi:hypothetical protein